MSERKKTEAFAAFGTDVFSDAVMRERLSPEIYAALRKTIDEGGTLTFEVAGAVARAMMQWAIEQGATHYTHWFQPMTGATAEKRDSFLSPGKLDQEPILDFSAKALIKGEADGSSFPSGGLRATFEARGYTTWDCTSPAFIKRNLDGSCCLCIPTAFCSFSGEALDEKTPLLRSMQALNEQALRVLRVLGDTSTTHVTPTVGAEQEYFLVNRKAFLKRKDLVYTGRTLFGAPPSKGQELSDQYYAATPERVMAFMHELNDALWRVGIPCKTEHNEAAPSQYELAQLYVSANLAVDQNQLVMEMMRRIADRHGLTCLLHEKPFHNVNGSGKHNNWSLATNDGKNLLKMPKNGEDWHVFYTFLLAVIAAVDEYAPMLRLSCASIGNEHRLGGHEAPPPILSIFLGEQLADQLEKTAHGSDPKAKKPEIMHVGVSTIADIRKDNSDRNRTSPFAFTGEKFEFRMVGSSQSLGMPNTVLNTIVAEQLRRIADRLEGAEDVFAAWQTLASELYDAHSRVLFNGNNYDAAWTQEAKRRGLPVVDNTVDAINVYLAKPVQDVFLRHGVFSNEELRARCEIALQNYATAGMIEASTMVKIVRQSILPAAARYSEGLAETVSRCIGAGIDAPAQSAMLRDLNRRMNECRVASDTLDAAMTKLAESGSSGTQAVAMRDRLLPRMTQLRQCVDRLETVVDKAFWPMPSYGELLFHIAE